MLVELQSQKWGLEEKEVSKKYPNRKERWDHLPVIPNAEKYNQLLKRILQEIDLIAKENPGKVVLVVAHGRVLKTVIADTKNSEDKIPYPLNCGTAVFRYTQGKLEFVEVRDNQ